MSNVMSLDEAIRHCRDKEDCSKCGQEHKQLRQWLENYRFLLSFGEEADRLKKLLECEYECVSRQCDGSKCNRDCAKCDLVQDDVVILEMYRKVISLLHFLKFAYLDYKLPGAHWIECKTADYHYCCSKCGGGYTDNKLSFCYDCGAEMTD